MRYAVHHGYLRAHNDAQRAKALSHAYSAVLETVDWLDTGPFASAKELQRFSHLIWWDHPSMAANLRGAHQAETKTLSRPTMHVNIGRAVHECRGPEAVAFAEAVISEVEHGIQEWCSDDPSMGYDRVDVVIYASGASTFAASRVAGILRAVVASLARHFPGRLHELTLLDLPKVLTWILRGATKLVHSETANKVHSLTLEEWQGSAGPNGTSAD
jgi:hypothetical protein